MAIKLHRCGAMWARFGAHPCWRVQKALDEQGIEYTIVRHPSWLKWSRPELRRLSGQTWLPVIEFEDGTVYREESKEMAATIRAGRLDEKRGRPAGSG